MQHYELMVRSLSPDELTLDDLAACAGLHPDLVARFVDFGLVQPVFDASKVLRLRSIQRLRAELGINLEGVAVVLDLVERLQTLERENAWLRAKL
jgi:DNA-binding transcriptional MerR regulator